ncbi:hypothetical protein [Colwellia psychrerythraea]|uniref:Uncharacterized protein n=1 Tax=Colwellia psychrerythraea TaxID=28229 RepID=A0A099L1G7_COLPS|nr:hypothetical protein [Colwellia psychrerythraea]KGJ96290.1 hypothetical protein GAB14E_0237 [Colwellia psychrerythraea]
MNNLDRTTRVFLDTNTAWENYTPLEVTQGRQAKPDFIGWSGLAPTNYLIKHTIGLPINAPKNEITWRINEMGRHVIEGLRFNGQGEAMNSVDLIANKRAELTDNIDIQCRQTFTLNIITQLAKKSYQVNCQSKTNIVFKHNL